MLYLFFLFPIFAYASVHDLKTMEIPDTCSLLLLLIAVFHHEKNSLCYALPLALAGASMAFAGALGMGDVKYTVGYTLIAGRRVFAALAIASSLALICLCIKKESGTARIPFAPYLSIGFMLALLLP